MTDSRLGFRRPGFALEAFGLGQDGHADQLDPPLIGEAPNPESECTIKNTPSNNNDACSEISGVANIKGNVASVIGTAPFSPTQERKVSSRQLNRNPSVDVRTATGRATSMSTTVISSACPLTPSRRLGKHNNPNATNMMIWASQAMASWNLRMPR